MKVSHKDEVLLMWFFERGVTTFWRSTQGAMLERAHALAYDSSGHRIPSSDAWSTGATLRVREHQEEAGYMPEDESLMRVAHVSRRLRLLGARDSAAGHALEAYYGRAGARWARTDQGRLFALYPLTTSGEAFVRADIAKRPDRDDDAHERILAEVQVQSVEPNDQRAELLAAMRGQSERLLGRAYAAWAATETRAVSGEVA